MERLANTILVIFGITGDLAQRKLLPALYHLAEADLFPQEFRVIGISRKGTTTEQILSLIRRRIGSGGKQSGEIYSRLEKIITIVDMNIDREEEYNALVHSIEKIEKEAGHPMNRLFYLAIPSTLFHTVTRRLGEKDINIHEKGQRECRFLIEKPFGYNLSSAQDLITELGKTFDESQIFRIDHYLAKETAQNILAFRFENPLFSSSWNRHHISHIMITAVESIGIEGRTAFYENMGAMRDLVQSHLLQLLALVTMNRPVTMSDADIHFEKEFILGKIRPPLPERMQAETVRGQYRTYRAETGNASSTTETYAALRLSIDTDEWRGVPIFIRTGKAIKAKVTEITIVFSDPKSTKRKNHLTIRIQPNEGIVIDLEIKKPGFDMALEKVQLDFCYNDKLNASHPDAYERVIVDAMRGDRTLFATSEEVLSCWRITEPVLEAWGDKDFPLGMYENNSWGPDSSDAMIGETGIEWLTDTHNVCSIPRIISRE